MEHQALLQIRTTLKLTYGLVPIVAGIDKFTDLLVDWDKYLNPTLAGMLPVAPHTFMLLVGVIEIIAGVLVFVRPRLGAYVVMAWLIGIALNLLLSGHYLDVAVRDLTMAVGAFTLTKVTEATTATDSPRTERTLAGRPSTAL